MSANNENILTISYTFYFKEGTQQTYKINLESNTLTILRKIDEALPEWTLLENFSCPHCPLDKTQFKYCPIAVNLKEIITFFSDTPSYEEVRVVVDTEERRYEKMTSVQVGVGGILGILMPTSGCPILGKLKPLVRFHLPFATIQETEYRVFSMFLLAQYLKMRKGEEPDWNLNSLKNLYEDLQKLNTNIARKIADLEKQDASINAVVVLNNFADSVTFCLDEDDVSDFEFLFKEFMEN